MQKTNRVHTLCFVVISMLFEVPDAFLESANSLHHESPELIENLGLVLEEQLQFGQSDLVESGALLGDLGRMASRGEVEQTVFVAEALELLQNDQLLDHLGLLLAQRQG